MMYETAMYIIAKLALRMDSWSSHHDMPDDIPTLASLQTAMEDDSSPGKVVEEFPPPPAYYRSCTSSDSLVPPEIPSTNPYLVAYSGSFAYIKENCPKFDDNKNYKEAIKS